MSYRRSRPSAMGSWVFGILAIALLVAGLTLPARQRSIHPSVLRTLARSRPPTDSRNDQKNDRAIATLRTILGQKPGMPRPNSPLLDQILPEAARNTLGAHLTASRSPAVSQWLSLRSMPVRTFPPAGSPGGEPLQAIIQLLAWMQEAEIWSPGISRATEEWMSRGDAESWEDFASATLSLAKRLPPSAFFELARRLESPGDWTGAAAWILRHPDRTEKFLDWVKASGSLGKVTVYLARHPNAPAWFQSLATTDASPIAALVSDGRPLGTGKLPAAWGIDFCARHSRTAVLIRWILLGAAAILGAAAVGRAGSSIEARNHHRMPFAVSSAIAGIFAAGFATMLAFVDDPTSEKSASPKYQIRLASPGAMAPSSTIAKNKVTMGTPTIVSLLIFGALQLAVYWAGRRKIREISDLDETPLIKLRLMENEENLFDAGLYVGMAGTAAALIFQVLGLFEANLLAAYASNLMGIVSVAVLKILSVRPFKEELILALDPSR